MKFNKNFLFLIVFFIFAFFLFYYTYKILYDLSPNQTQSIPEIKVEKYPRTKANINKIKPVIEKPTPQKNVDISDDPIKPEISIIEKKDKKEDDVLMMLELDRNATVEFNLKLIIDIIPLNPEYLKNNKIKQKYLSLLNYALKEMPNVISSSNQNYLCNSKNYIVSELEKLNSIIDPLLILKINKICLK